MSDTKRAKSTDMELNKKCINTIRVLAADTVQKANSGHPGAPMGCAPMAHALWSYVMNYNPGNPKWSNRDRFVLSNGHACALQYCMLHLTGYPLTIDDLKHFRQVGSKTPGHPENHITEGIEVSTGPLGQGISNAVGLALSERHLAGTYNRPGFDIVDHFTYVICGDGCLQEGVSGEACSLAGHLKLGKLIVLYDDNQITIDGPTSLSFDEDVVKRYEAYGWHTQTVSTGDKEDVTDLLDAIKAAQAETERPSLIKVKTTIGFGSAKQGTEKVHGSPLGDDDIASVKKLFGFDPEKKFFVPEDVAAHFGKFKGVGAEKEASWTSLFAAYEQSFPDLAAQYKRAMAGELPAGWEAELPTYKPTDKSEGSRKYSSHVLKAVVPKIPELIGGSADLTPSNNTKVPGNSVDFAPQTPEGRYIRFGVREHGMAAICNGIAAHGGLIPFGATFLTFTGYCLGSIRLSALSHLRVLYIFTHDSIGLGEDGPTHQPVETLAHLRALPNLYVFRPADGNETSGAYKVALAASTTPSVFALSRQSAVHVEGTSIDGVAKGAYTVQDAPNPQIILTATGTELSLVADAAKELAKEGIHARVVSFPCWELFDAQSQEYKESVFTPGVPVLSVEAQCTQGWEKYSHAQVGMHSFGASGPGGEVMKSFGFTVENVAAKAKTVVDFFKGSAPALIRKPF
ncbi:transketolase [Salpingoeca rosetta]|uniref:Transketolase n=1 Tax=Salpingoeca rosetta (strain ATCC 50818 / BSB-021) TaxID=946362 RepID=F2U283_SALR5|nr:transketolase [Salpingoeca rosetta]EGD81735.1 transketolase [Salpingoeca rosetta]|eukprot:XP_004996939.1 transketolase [Salpingoeca rosetta]